MTKLCVEHIPNYFLHGFSYGGHYGPAFFDYFYEQNEKIISGEVPGTALQMNSLMIINGIVSELVQAPQYPEFAM